jgi:adenine-specific DNA-methyltransferase
MSGLSFDTCLDAFGGTGAVAYRLKQAGKQVTYNDVLRFNYHTGVALVANSAVRLTPAEVDALLVTIGGPGCPTFIEDHFHDIYYTDEENLWLDRVVANIRALTDPYRYSLALFALCQACIIKRPYNLFHRKNLYVRLAQVKRSFGNKASWDRPFAEWFRVFAQEASQAVFDNSRHNWATNMDAIDVPGHFDLVYIDTPYIPANGVGVDYLDFYHFLEGIASYDQWAQHIDLSSKHRRFWRRPSAWTDKKRAGGAFDALFGRFDDSILVVSYRSDGIPT